MLALSLHIHNVQFWPGKWLHLEPYGDEGGREDQFCGVCCTSLVRAANPPAETVKNCHSVTVCVCPSALPMPLPSCISTELECTNGELSHEKFGCTQQPRRLKKNEECLPVFPGFLLHLFVNCSRYLLRTLTGILSQESRFSHRNLSSRAKTRATTHM